MKNYLTEQNQRWVEEVWNKLEGKMCAECERVGTKIPYIPEEGVYEDMGETQIEWWTNGFWTGLLWQMYHATGEEPYRTAAEGTEQRLMKILQDFVGMDHDTGFLWLHSAVANYRLTGNGKSFVTGLHAANVLAGRYNPNGKFIRAWGTLSDNNRAGWIIIDCLMNLPLLYWASAETKDPRFAQIAANHTDTAMRCLLRPDGSSNHIAALNPETGELDYYPDCQGYAPESSWSRGQSWAVYGMTLAYKHTGKPEYLDAARRCANYFIANVSDTDYVPLVDFRAPAEPLIYDTSAGACAACGLLELSELVSEYERPLYRNSAVKILKALAEKHCNWNLKEDSLVAQGCVAYHREDQLDVPLIYADYFFVEGIARLMDKDFLIW